MCITVMYCCVRLSFLKNKITPEDMPRRKRKRPLSLETDHLDLLPADAGELRSAVLPCSVLL